MGGTKFGLHLLDASMVSVFRERREGGKKAGEVEG